MRKLALIMAILLLLTAGCTREEEFVPPDQSEMLSPVFPDKDFFQGAELLELSGITPDSVQAVAFQVTWEDGSGEELLVSDRSEVARVYDLFAGTELAFDILLNTNPGTGEIMDMVWYLEGGGHLEIFLRGYLYFGDAEETLLFSSGASQDDFFALYEKLRQN